MKSISVGELRQNPSAALADVEKGATWRITRHNREIGRIVPPAKGPEIVAPKRRGPAHTLDLVPVEITSADSIDELIESAKGEW